MPCLNIEREMTLKFLKGGISSYLHVTLGGKLEQADELLKPKLPLIPIAFLFILGFPCFPCSSAECIPKDLRKKTAKFFP